MDRIQADGASARIRSLTYPSTRADYTTTPGRCAKAFRNCLQFGFRRNYKELAVPHVLTQWHTRRDRGIEKNTHERIEGAVHGHGRPERITAVIEPGERHALHGQGRGECRNAMREGEDERARDSGQPHPEAGPQPLEDEHRCTG